MMHRITSALFQRADERLRKFIRSKEGEIDELIRKSAIASTTTKKLINAIRVSLTSRDPQIVITERDHYGQPRLLVGERSKKGFKSLGYVDVIVDEYGDISMDADGNMVACHFNTATRTLTDRVMRVVP